MYAICLKEFLDKMGNKIRTELPSDCYVNYLSQIPIEIKSINMKRIRLKEILKRKKKRQ